MAAEPGSESRPPFPVSSPFCADLQTKKLYFLDGPAASEEELLDGSGHCWCLRTMQSLGPDGEPVDPAGCRAGRACFRSIL